MSFESIWVIRTSSVRASSQSAGAASARTRSTSTIAAHSVVEPRTMTKERAFSGDDDRPSPSAIVEDRRAGALQLIPQRAEPSARRERPDEPDELEREPLDIEALSVEQHACSRTVRVVPCPDQPDASPCPCP
jgi:hypothetical protein